MKKIISFMLIFLLCAFFFGCGENGKVENNTKTLIEQLEVSWEAKITEKDSVFVVAYIFDDGEVEAIIELRDKYNPNDAMKISTAYGTYEFTEDKIIIDWEETNYHIDLVKMTPDHELTYKYSKGELSLFTSIMQVGGEVLELKPEK